MFRARDITKVSAWPFISGFQYVYDPWSPVAWISSSGVIALTVERTGQSILKQKNVG
jgi:hypothetical protein